MKLEDLSLTLRPRRSWEAVDLGCALVRRHYGRLMALWAVTVLPLWVLLAVVLWQHPAWFALVVWWLKPLYDRVPLFFISRVTFGAAPGFRETWKAWPRLWGRFLLPALLWRRPSFIRSFALPVWMLEGQRGAAVRKRLQGLALEGGGAGSSATLAFLHLEAVVMVGLLVLLNPLAPSTGLPPLEDWFEGLSSMEFDLSLAYYWYLNALYLVAVTVMEPFYVGAGFGLYLNARAKLEGWDVEVSFRRLAGRLQAGARRVAVLLAGFLLLGGSTLAQQAVPAETTIEAVMEHPDFEIHRESFRWWEWEEGPESEEVSLEWVEPLLGFVGYVMLAVFLGILIWFLVKAFMQARPPTQRARGPKPTPARVVMGMEITEESLPADLLAAAEEAWNRGHPREALSLLYRGALARLVLQHRVPIRESDTEHDCLQRVEKASLVRIADYFRDLTRSWVELAYARRVTPDERFSMLIRDWPFRDATETGGKATAAVMAIGWSLLLVGCAGEWREEEREVGFKGKARVDPFLAMQRFLEDRGHFTERSEVMLHPPREGVLFTSAEEGMPEGRAAHLLAWVEQGGHLLYTCAGGTAYNDWGILGALGGFGYFGSEDRPDAILEALGVEVERTWISAFDEEESEAGPEEASEPPADEIELAEDVETDSVTLRWRKKRYELDLPPYLAFGLDRELGRGEFRAGGEDGDYLLSLRHGAGRVTVLNHARPLRNRYIGDADHAVWLDAVIGRKPKEIRLVLGYGIGFWGFFWGKTWPFLVALTVFLLFWLWRNLLRFGPVREAELHPVKRFSEHLHSLGQFFHRMKCDDVLVEAARANVHARLAASHPQVASGGDETVARFLAESSGLPENRVRQVMDPEASGTPSLIVRQLQDLQTLHNAL